MSKPVSIEIFDDGPVPVEALEGPCPDTAQIILEQELRRVGDECGEGVRVYRYWLGENPADYRDHPQVAALLRARGAAVLPITLVDGQVLRMGSYPALGDIERPAGRVLETLDFGF